MTLAAGLIAARFLHYLAVSALFGVALFPLYAIRLSAGGYESLPWLPRLLKWAAALTLVTGIVWLVFAAAGMSGSLESTFHPATLSLVVGSTEFGQVWAVRLALAAILTFVTFLTRAAEWRNYVVLGGSLLLVTSIAATGHSGADDRGVGDLHRIADAVHLMTAAIWIGALLALGILLRMSARSSSHAEVTVACDALVRFSGIGASVVGLLLLSGLANSWFLIGPDRVTAVFTTPYGEVLLVKVALFGAMLFLAAANRFLLTPKLASALAADGRAQSMGALRTSIFAETVLGILVLAAAAWLGTLSPPAFE